MDPARKRTIRLVAALAAAVFLGSALVYTSFSAAREVLTPSQFLRVGGDGRWYQLTGKVAPGYRQSGQFLLFRLRDRSGTTSVSIRYSGEVPDPFATGRDVIVTVQRQGDAVVGQRDSLVTKCPSKFKSSGTV